MALTLKSQLHGTPKDQDEMAKEKRSEPPEKDESISRIQSLTKDPWPNYSKSREIRRLTK